MKHTENKKLNPMRNSDQAHYKLRPFDYDQTHTKGEEDCLFERRAAQHTGQPPGAAVATCTGENLGRKKDGMK